MNRPSEKSIRFAIQQFEENGGIMRTAQAISAGVQPRTLYWMRDHGILDRLSRGVYHLKSFPLPPNPDVTAVMKRIPRAVLCLVSALDQFDVGTHIPSSVQIALPTGMKTPRIDRPQITVFRMSERSMKEGVTFISISGTKIAVFNLAKTIADCFKFRNRIGLDIAVEAIQEVVRNNKCSPGDIMHYAKVNRVDSVIRPYLEALL
jgi:predicted transcriptional regulator of viral defense system